MVTDGTTYAVAAGLRYAFTDKLRLVGEIYYAPLDVIRNPTAGAENDALLNAGLLVGYSLR